MQKPHWTGSACRHKEEPTCCWPKHLHSCLVGMCKNPWSSRTFLTGDVLQISCVFFVLHYAVELLTWMQSKRVTSRGRWTRNEIFLSNNVLAVVEAADVTYLTCHCFDRNGLVQAVTTTGLQKKSWFKGKYPFGKGWEQISRSDGVNKSAVRQEASRLGSQFRPHAAAAERSLCFWGEDQARRGERLLLSDLGFLFLCFQYGA